MVGSTAIARLAAVTLEKKQRATCDLQDSLKNGGQGWQGAKRRMQNDLEEGRRQKARGLREGAAKKPEAERQKQRSKMQDARCKPREAKSQDPAQAEAQELMSEQAGRQRAGTGRNWQE